MRPLLVIACCLAFTAGCSEALDPVTPGPRPFVVFGILNSALDTQIVRVHGTSEPGEPNPPITSVLGTTVTVVGPTGTIPFQAVNLTGTPGTRDSLIPAFRAAPFRPIRGATYTLIVTTPDGSATGTLVVPDFVGEPMTLLDPGLLRTPHTYPLETPIPVTSVLARQALGYVVRFQIEYEALKTGIWITENREVPLWYLKVNGPTDFFAVYPELLRRTGSAALGYGAGTAEATIYSNSAYERTISLIHAQYGSVNVRMKRAVFLLEQADQHFFTYYSFANSFQDPLTIRVDQPDYSNMSGSLGFFGSLTIDTLAYPLPSGLKPR